MIVQCDMCRVWSAVHDEDVVCAPSETDPSCCEECFRRGQNCSRYALPDRYVMCCMVWS